MVTNQKSFLQRRDLNFQLCSEMPFFFGKVFPLLKNGQNKCPNSLFPKNFRKKKQNIPHFFKLP